MSTYSDILAGIRANAVKTPQGDGKTVLAKFLNGTIGKPTEPTEPTEKQPPTPASENAEIPPPDASAQMDGTTDAPGAGSPESSPDTHPDEAETQTDAPAPEPAPETMSAGALPEPDDAGDLFEPPPPPKRHGARRR